MNIILSRNGFDSSYGGVLKPIPADGTLLSLRIPCRDSPISQDELGVESQPIGALVEELTQGRVRGGHGAHVAPDLWASMFRRLPGDDRSSASMGRARPSDELRRLFKDLVEVANERGPGYDVLDPFGVWGAAPGADRVDPRRVEVKAILRENEEDGQVTTVGSGQNGSGRNGSCQWSVGSGQNGSGR